MMGGSMTAWHHRRTFWATLTAGDPGTPVTFGIARPTRWSGGSGADLGGTPQHGVAVLFLNDHRKLQNTVDLKNDKQVLRSVRRSSEMSDFTGRKFVITGAGTGIGARITQRVIGKGASVIGIYNTAAYGARKLEREFPDALKMFHADLANPASIGGLVDSLLGEGMLDGLVNNAGAIDFRKWDDFSIDEWRKVFAVNVDAPVVLVHALRKNFTDGASIVNIASTDGMIGSFGSAAYSASKAAMLNVTKSLANLLGPDGLRVNSIAPGWIDTGMSTAASSAAGELTPLGRNGTPDEVAGVVDFLLGDDSRFVTGTSIIVDGGYSNVDMIMKQEYADLYKDGTGLRHA
jgi:3-oxoacyl-[acyl-carrier protein] reductase